MQDSHGSLIPADPDTILQKSQSKNEVNFPYREAVFITLQSWNDLKNEVKKTIKFNGKMQIKQAQDQSTSRFL